MHAHDRFVVAFQRSEHVADVSCRLHIGHSQPDHVRRQISLVHDPELSAANTIPVTWSTPFGRRRVKTLRGDARLGCRAADATVDRLSGTIAGAGQGRIRGGCPPESRGRRPLRLAGKIETMGRKTAERIHQHLGRQRHAHRAIINSRQPSRSERSASGDPRRWLDATYVAENLQRFPCLYFRNGTESALSNILSAFSDFVSRKMHLRCIRDHAVGPDVDMHQWSFAASMRV